MWYIVIKFRFDQALPKGDKYVRLSFHPRCSTGDKRILLYAVRNFTASLCCHESSACDYEYRISILVSHYPSVFPNSLRASEEM